MIFPCPGFLPVVLTAAFFLGGGAGSSSEKDSHAGSSTVTTEVICVRKWTFLCRVLKSYQGSLHHL